MYSTCVEMIIQRKFMFVNNNLTINDKKYSKTNKKYAKYVKQHLEMDRKLFENKKTGDLKSPA